MSNAVQSESETQNTHASAARLGRWTALLLAVLAATMMGHLLRRRGFRRQSDLKTLKAQ